MPVKTIVFEDAVADCRIENAVVVLNAVLKSIYFHRCYFKNCQFVKVGNSQISFLDCTIIGDVPNGVYIY